MIIPLKPGSAFLRFSVTLSGRNIRVVLRWSTRYGFYSVDLYEGDVPLVRGRGLHPEVDLIGGLNLGIGKLYLSGKPATIENLGQENKLRYEP